MLPADCHLQLLVTRALCRHPLRDLLGEALDGGVDLIQVREKDCSGRDLEARVREVLAVTEPRGVPVLVNDDLEVAARLPVAGVHLGQEDASPEEARRLLGDAAWIGLSTHSVAEVVASARPTVTHLGLGAWFATGTRPGSPVLAREAARAAVAAADRPLFAIGGITPDHLPELVSLGVRRVAVSSAILSAEEPGEVARRLRESLPRA